MYKGQEHTRIETVKLAEVGTSPSSCGGLSLFCCGGRHQLKNSSYLLDHVHVKKWVPCAINFAPSDVNGHSAPQVHQPIPCRVQYPTRGNNPPIQGNAPVDITNEMNLNMPSLEKRAMIQERSLRIRFLV